MALKTSINKSPLQRWPDLRRKTSQPKSKLQFANASGCSTGVVFLQGIFHTSERCKLHRLSTNSVEEKVGKGCVIIFAYTLYTNTASMSSVPSMENAKIKNILYCTATPIIESSDRSSRIMEKMNIK